VATVEELPDKPEGEVNAAEKRVRMEDGTYIVKDASQSVLPDKLEATKPLGDELSVDQDAQKRWVKRIHRQLGDKTFPVT